MNCEQIRPSLLDYAKGLLSGPEASTMARHLDRCPDCKKAMAEELEFACRLAEMPIEEPRNDVWALVRAQTKPRRLSIYRIRHFVSVQAMSRKVLALTAAVGVLVGLVYTGMEPEKPKSVVQQRATATSVAVGWSDDPIGPHTDAMVKFIDDM